MKLVHNASLKACVPPFVSNTRGPISEIDSKPVGLNERHERRLMGALMAWYGWTWGEDGHLYNPRPNRHAWGQRG